MMDQRPVENARGALREPVQHRRVERLLIVRPQEAADAEAAGSELEDLPGVVGVTLNTITGSFDIVFDRQSSRTTSSPQPSTTRGTTSPAGRRGS